MPEPKPIAADSWAKLRPLTAARIGLGRAGAGIPTGETLRFKLAHAQARDAVHNTLDHEKLAAELPFSVLHLHSAAIDRIEYLQRPDLGRTLSPDSRKRLQHLDLPASDLAIVIADGLSALAIQRNVVSFLKHFCPLIAPHFSLAPLVIVRQGRVAIGDEIGHLLRARAVAVFIGERPGLSSPDSLGIYLTYAPRPGLTDERRNCISNIRHAGLPHQAGAEKLAWLLHESLTRQISGINLKDEMPPTTLPLAENQPKPHLAIEASNSV